jgi:hypothetical protein
VWGEEVSVGRGGADTPALFLPPLALLLSLPPFLSSLFCRRAVSYLALAHGADRGIAWQTTFAGGTLGFARGEEDMSACLRDLTGERCAAACSVVCVCRVCERERERTRTLLTGFER